MLTPGFLLRCAALLLSLPAWAHDFSALQPQGYLSDFAGVVDAKSKSEIERYCRRVQDSTGAQIALVTLPSLEGEPVEDVANLLFRKWGVGAKQTNEGILLLLAIRERKSRLEVGYGLEPILPDGSVGAILREMRPALRENHYGDAMLAAAGSIGSRIAQAKGVSVGDAPRPRQRRNPEGFPVWVLVFGILGLIWLMRRSGVRGGPFWWGGLPGGGSWGSSSGGFGGYDSGGGDFGGFGGGDSGGGGASSDW